MNAIAAAPGWRGLAIWVMPPVAYALASDTLIGVVRTWTITRNRARQDQPGNDERAPLAALGALVLWLVRLALAPRSTLRGFRAWVITECPTSPASQADHSRQATAPAAIKQLPAAPKPIAHRSGTKTAVFLSLAAESYGPLASIPLDKVSKISAELAPKADLHPGTARTALRRAVLAAKNGSTR
ncbi:MAG TPA: hypothetical protein VFQ44_27165 [Streptosporangiaceae bacterium]|nr:hypothetical protein [Streptosporangiaceae bacterium]